MEKLYVFLVLAFTVVVGNAQIINFPDAAFKTVLLNYSPVIDTNSDGEIQESEALGVTNLTISNSTVNSLIGIEYFLNITQLICVNNPQLTALNVTNLSSLQVLKCNNNSLTSLDLNLNIQNLVCNNNQLAQINLIPLTNLKSLDVSYNQLTSLVLPAVPNFSISNAVLNISGNLYTSVDLSNLNSPSGTKFICDNTHITELDFSHLHNRFYNYEILNNQDLQNINFKNGFLDGCFLIPFDPYDCIYYISNNSSLNYVCVDDNYESDILSGVLGSSVLISTYCTFTPGGPYYTVQGNTFFDSDTNGCDATDIIYPNLALSFTDGINTGELHANNTGSYSIPFPSGTQTITPAIVNSTYFTISPATVNVAFPATASPFVQNFCVIANGVHNDLEVILIPLNRARPGFDANYKIIYKNRGTTSQSGSLSLTFDDSKMDLVSVTPINASSSTNNLSWSFSNLQPFETREILLTMNINSPTETPAVNGGTILFFSGNITGLTDETPIDNASALDQVVFNSIDPNDKTCVEGITISPSMVGQYVHYVIRFENTGTANAQNIVVKDIIDTAKYDVSSLVPLSGSASYITRITNTNKVEFIFENINLPFAVGSNNGYVAFKIKTKPTLVVGDTFSNSANIYFDYNFPITTNTTTTTIATLGTADFEFSNVFSLSPVPAKNLLTITTKQAVEMSSVSIYNTLGQLVQVNTNPNETIDVSGLKTGSYFIKIVSGKGTASGKFLKE